MVNKDNNKYNMPIKYTLDKVTGKWKALIIWQIRQGTKRFGELGKLIPDITEKMLTQQLRELERDGIISRQEYAEVPPRVEYSITSEGEELYPILDLMWEWGYDQMKKLK